MKLFTVMMCCFTLSLSASSYAQQERINLKMKDVTVKALLDEIQRQTSFHFIFNTEQTDQLGNITVNVNNEPLENVLKDILKNSGLEYVFRDNIIVIKKQDESPATPQVKEMRITGTVTEAGRQALSGATIRIMIGKQILGATITDKNGKYALSIPESQETIKLVFSFIGMKNVEVKYTGQQTINVVLEEDSEQVEEVVVTGYQTILKKMMAGSTSHVKNEDLFINGTQTLEQILQGAIPGMVVMNTSGLTGTRQRVRVRGTSTLLGNAEPVWVVDGIIQDDPLPFKANQFNDLDQSNLDMMRNFVGGAVSWLNPYDIEDITVLKDASATAIYGIKAANGVIVITTKRGKIGTTSVGYSGNFSYTPRMSYEKLELMNSQQRVDVSREAFEKDYLLSTGVNYNIGYTALALAFRDNRISLEEFSREARKLERNNTDYFKLLFRDAISHNHTVSISGGSDQATYRSSFGVSNNKNSAKGNEQTQYTGSLNVNSTLWDNITLTTSLNGSHSTTKAFADKDPYNYARSTNRSIPFYGENGERIFYASPENGYLFNIMHELEQSGNENTLSSLNAALSFRWQIFKELQYNLTLSYSVSNSMSRKWYTELSNYIAGIRGYDFEAFAPGSDLYEQSMLPHGGELQEAASRSNNWSWRHQVQYSKIFKGLHALVFMAGQEARSNKMYESQKVSYGYMHEKGRIFSILPSNSTLLLGGLPEITDTESNTVSLYSTLSYMYDERYAINANVRMDASNRFGADKSTRFLPIWALALRWNVGREHWLQGQNILSDLSLKASYGWQGNAVENVSPDLIAQIYPAANGGYGLKIVNLPAPRLKWEKIHNMNFGVDFSLFNKKINGSFEYYKKQTQEMIVQADVPYEHGTSLRPLNDGTMDNSGWELSVSFVPVRTKDLMVSVGLNTSKTYNKINSRIQPIGTWQQAASGNLNKEGYAVSSFWAFRFTGLNPEHGGPEFNFDGCEREGARSDATFYMDHAGKIEPDFSAGLSLNIRYKTFTLSSGLYLSVGNQKFMAPLESANWMALPSEYENMSTEWLKRWRKPGDEKYTSVPALPNPANNAKPGDWFDVANGFYPYEFYASSTARVVDAWYLRCQNISLSYTLPEGKLPHRFKNLNVNCSITNPFQIRSKDFLGRDPEVAMGQQPLSRSVSLGVSMNF